MLLPAIKDLFIGLSRQQGFEELLHAVRTPRPPVSFSLSGLNLTAKAIYSVLLWRLTERPLVILVDGNREAETLFETIQAFFYLLAPERGAGPQLLPALDVLPSQSLSPHAEICEQRAIGLWRMAASGRVPITVAPIASALLRIQPAEFYKQLAQTLTVGEEVPLDDLVVHLESMGYRKREPVEMVGEYSVRGGILDVFSPEAPQPVRVELFGDQIESIRRFEVESQRSVLKLESCTLLPLTEWPNTPGLEARIRERLFEFDLDVSIPNDLEGGISGWEFLAPLVTPREGSILSLLRDPIVLQDEPDQIRSAAERFWKRLLEGPQTSLSLPEKIYFRWEQFEAQAAPLQQVLLRELEIEGAGAAATARAHISSRPSLAFRGNLQVAVAESRTLVESGARVVFFAETAGELERLGDIFHEYGVGYQIGVQGSGQTPEYLANHYSAGVAASVFLLKGPVAKGVHLADSRLSIFGSEDLFDTSDLVARPSSKSHLATFSADLLDFKPGDYVVHAEHGVGKFLGLRELEHGDTKGDFMLIEYSGGSKLYLPLARMDLVQRFRGAGESAPTLDRMGGITWGRTKTRVKAKMRDMAEELLKLYAQRRLAQGFAFSPGSNWQREFEDAFEYDATKDQLSATNEIKRDMESSQPMDRLLCGDVGFGKTEVVMRAAFKALGDGKQVAVLAPTIVLCFQHFETFKRRFQSFPVRVDMLSRFRSSKEIKESLADISEGKVDIAIGTHRLLSGDVKFNDLGLVIVDEEQRFGVKHKEKLKHFRHNVDVVSMSATPIPRTLHMSLLGLRDMSVIETPPKDRLAIQTTVGHFHPDLIKAAIELELGRRGQVYFLHNRVDSIWSRAALLQELAPHARIGVGHGQMGEADLEKAMLRFVRHECDIFVCTTIIENGLDIPLANTIIIENAEKYGLSELYQLRGRVGRSNRRAYAYLLIPPDTELTEIARKRLAALKEFSDLGAGFKIAALDLELRGAGNLLGGEQHGHINAIGFDTYVRMLEETVRELKGEEVAPEIHSTLNLGLDLRIPPGYITDENQRLRAYKRIAGAADDAGRETVETELADRYGPTPDAVRNLLEYSALKTASEKIGVEIIDRRGPMLNIKFHQESRVDPAKLTELVKKTPGTQFTPAGVLRIPVESAASPAEILGFLKRQLALLG